MSVYISTIENICCISFTGCRNSPSHSQLSEDLHSGVTLTVIFFVWHNVIASLYTTTVVGVVGWSGFYTQICQQRIRQGQSETRPDSSSAARQGAGSPSVSFTLASGVWNREMNSWVHLLFTLQKCVTQIWFTAPCDPYWMYCIYFLWQSELNISDPGLLSVWHWIVYRLYLSSRIACVTCHHMSLWWH